MCFPPPDLREAAPKELFMVLVIEVDADPWGHNRVSSDHARRCPVSLGNLCGVRDGKSGIIDQQASDRLARHGGTCPLEEKRGTVEITLGVPSPPA